MHVVNVIVKYTVISNQAAINFEEHLNKIEKDPQEREKEKELDLELNGSNVLRRTDNDRNDEGKGNTDANPDQTSRLPKGGPNKTNITDKTNDQ